MRQRMGMGMVRALLRRRMSPRTAMSSCWRTSCSTPQAAAPACLHLRRLACSPTLQRRLVWALPQQAPAPCAAAEGMGAAGAAQPTRRAEGRGHRIAAQRSARAACRRCAPAAVRRRSVRRTSERPPSAGGARRATRAVGAVGPRVKRWLLQHIGCCGWACSEQVQALGAARLVLNFV